MARHQQPLATSTTAIPLWEQFCTAYVLMMLTGAIIGPVLAPEQGEHPVLRLFWLPSYALTAGLCLLRWREILRVWPALFLVGGMAFLTLASTYWSIDPETSQRRFIALTINSAFAVYLGARYRGFELPRLLAMACLWMGALSIVFVFALPQIGIHHGVNDGLWRGVWYEKNQMGLVMTAGGTSAAAWMVADKAHRKIAATSLGICTLLVLATASKTSLACLMLGVGIVFFISALNKGGPVLGIIAVWLAVVIAGAGWWVWTQESAFLLGLIGKDPTLTGRTDIWEAVLKASSERPLLGYGYNAFWGEGSLPASWVRNSTQWDVPSAHHGWLDLLLELGWVGALTCGAVLAIACVLHLFRITSEGRAEGWWSLAYLGAFLLLSLSESVVMTAQNLPWVLCIAILARAFTSKRNQLP